MDNSKEVSAFKKADSDKMANEILIAGIFIVVAVNAFLYYRLHSLQEKHDHVQRSSRLGFAREVLDAFHSEFPAQKTQSGDLLGEAKGTQAELRKLANDDLTQIHQRLVSTEEKLSS